MNEKAADRKKYLAISPVSGDVTIKETDLVTGVGDFPESLPFTRTYTSEPSVTDVTEMIQTDWEILGAGASGGSIAYSQRYSGPDSSAKARLGGGWNHNYNVTASVSGNGDKAFGSESALDASASIAMLWSFYGASRAPTFASRLTSTIGMDWLANQLAFNAAVVDKGGTVDSFQRLPDGSFNTLGAGRLVQTGAPTPTQDWSGVTLRYTGADGDTIDFIPGYWSRHHYGSAGGDTREKAEPSFIATYWTFPDGNKVSFEYTTAWMQTSWAPYVPPSCSIGDGSCNWSVISNMPWGYLLHKVSNSRGRSLTFDVVPTTLHVCCTLNGTDFNVTSTFRISGVTDESGRHVDYSLDCGGFACGTFTATAPDTKQTRYSYTAGTDSPDSSAGVRPSYRLRRWYTPGDLTHAYQTVAYDDLYRARTLTDILQRVTNYYPGAVAGSELWKRSEVVDPLGLSTVSLFDQWNSAVSVTDPLARVRLTTYDGARRKTEETNPDKDRVGYAYDVRGNVLTTTRYPKPGSNLTPTTTTTDYLEGSTVWNCAKPASCNKPKSEDGPRTDVTDVTNYAWNDTTGNLTQILKPADVSNVRPQIDLDYTNYAGVDGATLSLLSKKTVKVDSTRSSVTTYDYDTANKLVLKTSTVDQGDTSHLNLRTCFKFDTYGGLTQVTDPRATTCP
jgi:YD repeat-containing protein